MSRVADFLFQSRILKEIPRSGFAFLGSGKESVAEHTYSTAVIAFVMAQQEDDVDAGRLISMCLVHDLTEARLGDLNTVNKTYVSCAVDRALKDSLQDLPFGAAVEDLIREFEANQTPEARLARDADQLALIMELKALADIGCRPPEKWLPKVVERLQTASGRRLAEDILQTPWDNWWFNNMG
ncbi:MAG: HD domain-containing protein [Deltaproteobacteria bacterium]|nr:HD domain-containing protein [Deltaproteobacteria bacterium]